MTRGSKNDGFLRRACSFIGVSLVSDSSPSTSWQEGQYLKTKGSTGNTTTKDRSNPARPADNSMEKDHRQRLYSQAHFGEHTTDSTKDHCQRNPQAVANNEGSSNTHQHHGQHQHTMSKQPEMGKSKEDFRTEGSGTPPTSQNLEQPCQKITREYPPRPAIFRNGDKRKPLRLEQTAQHWYERHYNADLALQKLQEEKKQWEMHRETLEQSSKKRETESSREKSDLLYQIGQLQAVLEAEKTKLGSQKKELEERLNSSLQEQRRNHRHETEALNTALNDARQQTTSVRKQHSLEMKKNQSKLNELEAEQIQSINSIGTGLEPIATHTFEDRFRALHDEIYKWCRKAFPKGQRLAIQEMHESIPHLLRDRFQNIGDLSHAQLINTITWYFIENYILSNWIPGLPEEAIKHLSMVEHFVRSGDKSEALEKSNYWRAYTASLLYQSEDYQKATIARVDQMGDFLFGWIACVHRKSKVQDKVLTAILQSLHSVHILGADMKCQRGVYKMTNDVQLGDLYDESNMIDVKFSGDDDEEGKQRRVTAILSRGWVKLQFEESTEILARICKTRVVVGSWPEQQTSQAGLGPNGAGAPLIDFTAETNRRETPADRLPSGLEQLAREASTGQNRSESQDGGASVGSSDRMDICEDSCRYGY